MGLFCLNPEKEHTVEGCMEAAYANLKILKDHNDCDYLIDFVIGNLRDAIKAAEKGSILKKENNKWDW